MIPFITLISNNPNTVAMVETVITYGTYLIGTSALAFGIYDIYHQKWTGDLKVMATTLDTSALILFALAFFNITDQLPALIFGITYLIASYKFLKQLKNPNLAHESRKQKQWWDIINEYIDKILAK